MTGRYPIHLGNGDVCQYDRYYILPGQASFGLTGGTDVSRGHTVSVTGAHYCLLCLRPCKLGGGQNIPGGYTAYIFRVEVLALLWVDEQTLQCSG